jgi:hypothetical protein
MIAAWVQILDDHHRFWQEKKCGTKRSREGVSAQPTAFPEFLQTTRQPSADALGVVVGFVVVRHGGHGLRRGINAVLSRW